MNHSLVRLGVQLMHHLYRSRATQRMLYLGTYQGPHILMGSLENGSSLASSHVQETVDIRERAWTENEFASHLYSNLYRREQHRRLLQERFGFMIALWFDEMEMGSRLGSTPTSMWRPQIFSKGCTAYCPEEQ